MVKKSIEEYSTTLAPLLIIAVLAGFTMIPAFGQSSANAARTFTFPLDAILNAQCTGEPILITGTAHVTVQTTFPDDLEREIQHSTVTINFQGVTGVGQLSGDRYRVTNADHLTSNSFSGPSSVTTIARTLNFIAVGQGGSGFNTIVHTNVHVTFTPNGDLTVLVDDIDIRCT